MFKRILLLIVSITVSLFHQSAGADQKKWDIERVKDADGNIIALKVMKKGDKNIHQDLRDFTATPPEHAVQGGFDVEFKDINFDGNDDILVFEFLPAGPNVPFLYWIYNPVSGKFECRDPDPDDNLCRIYPDEIDYEKKQVIEFYRDGATIHGTRYHTWQDGKLIVVKEVVEEMDNSGKMKVTEKELKNGELTVTKQYIK